MCSSRVRKPNNNDCEKLEKKTYYKLTVCTVLGSVLLFVGTVSLITSPVHTIAKYMTRISPGSLYYEILKQRNIPGAYIYTYIFNVTNADRFLSGQDYKLKVEEVGPFTYQEFRTNDRFELDEDAGVMRYSPNLHTSFLPKHSVVDPKQINVTVPNIAMLAMTSYVSAFPYWSRAAFNVFANRLRSKSMMLIDAHRFLWGYNEPLIHLVHTLMPGWITFGDMGILDRLYDSGNVSLELGATDGDKFLIKSINGQGGLNQIGYDNPSTRTRCNTLVDTYEGIVYPPDITKDTPLRLYRNVFCRILDLEYQGSVMMDYGPEAFVYRFGNKTFSKTPETDCLKIRPGIFDGVSDLSPCFFGLGLVLSNAHYLHADPKVYDRIEGMKPNEHEHGSEFIIDPKLGAVLTTRFTLQLNLRMDNVDFNSQAKPFSNITLPIAYFKIVQPEMTDVNKESFWRLYVLVPYMWHVGEAVCIVVGALLLAYTAKQYYWARCVQENGMRFKAANMKPCNITQEEPLMDEKIYNKCQTKSNLSMTVVTEQPTGHRSIQ